jgi:hypothetical protein
MFRQIAFWLFFGNGIEQSKSQAQPHQREWHIPLR